MVTKSFPAWAEIINLKDYPIEDLNTAQAQALLARCRHSLQQDGSCEMPGFVTPLALERLVQEGHWLEGSAFHNSLVGNAYLDELDPSLPEGDPRRAVDVTSLGAVAYDEFPMDSWLRKIYEWDPVMRFIGAILELPEIFRYGDPMSGLNLAVMKDGDYLRWHFDQCDFVTSLAIQLSDTGGEFEFIPRLRSADNPNYEKVSEVLAGSREGVVTLANTPGTLLLFQGHNSIHRVTKIKGMTPRLIALLSYAEKADLMGTEYLRRIRYGRVTSHQAPRSFAEVGHRAS
ncbi:MAG: hypothetical protein KDD51_00655 [Bdellovibrionales bacterium]|nr:hypothetical protein [Bdellovibrionales bacterium]